MSITSLSQLVWGQTNNLNRSGKAQRITLEALASVKSGDTAVAAPTKGYSASANGLRGTLERMLKTSAALEIAGSAVKNIDTALGKLEKLAVQARQPGLSPAEQSSLHSRYKEAVAEIDKITDTAQFQNKLMLDGSFASEGLSSGSLRLSDLRPQSLLADAADPISLSTPDNTLDKLKSARNALSSQYQELQQTLEELGTMSIGFEVALQNRLAADSVIKPEKDDISILDAMLQMNTGQSGKVQGNRLPVDLLNLIG